MPQAIEVLENAHGSTRCPWPHPVEPRAVRSASYRRGPGNLLTRTYGAFKETKLSVLGFVLQLLLVLPLLNVSGSSAHASADSQDNTADIVAIDQLSDVYAHKQMRATPKGLPTCLFPAAVTSLCIPTLRPKKSSRWVTAQVPSGTALVVFLGVGARH
jgi:hypothetical protein